MSDMCINKAFDDDVVMSEREEGEISDLDLEDVSDCSLNVGKSSGQTKVVQYVRDLSFSSISDSESASSIVCSKCGSVNCNGHHCSRHKHKVNKCKCVNNKQSISHHTKSLRRYKNKICRYKSANRRSRHIENVSSSSDSDDNNIDRSLLQNLNKAVRVKSPIPETLQTSLRTRLKNMLNGISNKSDDSDSELDINELRKLALESKIGDLRRNIKSGVDLHSPLNINLDESNKSLANESEFKSENSVNLTSETNESFIDDEANQLRLAALRSAILKKHEARKQKKKEKDEQVTAKSNNSELNNHILSEKLETHLVENINDNFRSEVIIPNVSQNKAFESEEIIIENEKSLNLNLNKTVEEDEDILRAMLLSSISKKITTSNIEQFSKPQIKSDELIQKEIAQNKINSSKNVQYSVTVQPLIINVSSNSESETEDVLKTQESFKNKFEDSLSKFLRDARAEVEKQQMEKVHTTPSSVKILPPSRQVEYARLRKRLDMLSSNKYKSQKCLPSWSKDTNILLKNSLKDASKKLIKKSNDCNIFSYEGAKIMKPLKSRNVLINNQNIHLKENQPAKSISNDIRPIGKSNMPKRFLEGKYKSLAPIVKRTKAARIARDQAGEEVNRLIENLKTARLNYIECHQEYKACVQKYLHLKSTIEGETANSNVLKRISNENHNVIETKCMKTEMKNQTEMLSKQNLLCEKSDLLGSHREQDSVQLSTSDVNNQNSLKDVPKRLTNQNDPAIEICPFDLQGVCRDAECEYRHF